jgi:hypothetical protein
MRLRSRKKLDINAIECTSRRCELPLVCPVTLWQVVVHNMYSILMQIQHRPGCRATVSAVVIDCNPLFPTPRTQLMKLIQKNCNAKLQTRYSANALSSHISQ